MNVNEPGADLSSVDFFSQHLSTGICPMKKLLEAELVMKIEFAESVI